MVDAFAIQGGLEITVLSRCLLAKFPQETLLEKATAQMAAVCTEFAFVANACVKLVTKALTALAQTNLGGIVTDARMTAEEATLPALPASMAYA